MRLSVNLNIYTLALILMCIAPWRSNAETYECESKNGWTGYKDSSCDAGSAAKGIKETKTSSSNLKAINKPAGPVDASKANQALKNSYGREAIPPEIIILRTTLGEFDRLDKQFDALANNYYLDASYEMALRDSFHNAAKYHGMRLSDLDNWVNNTQSAYAYAARGYYYSHASAFDDSYASNAFSDFKTALSKSPKLSPAYAEMLSMARYTELPLNINEIFKAALEAEPRSFYVRYQYILSVAPSLNNKNASNEMINRIATQAQSYADENPRLYTLLGDIYADKAHSANYKNDCSTVVSYYTKAFEYGERVGWLEARAACLYKLGKKNEAKSDYQRILYYEPTHVKAGEWARWIKAELRG